MYDRIDAVTFKISEYCNLDCVYCFQKYDTKTRYDGFTDFDQLVKFLRKMPLGDTLEFKVTGGESSLHCDKIRSAYRKLKKLERYKNVNIEFTTISNGTNIDGLTELWNDGILNPWGCKISWDGVYSASKSRKVKNNSYDDEYFKDIIRKLGKSDYRDKVLVRTALTPDTVDELYQAYRFAIDNGCTKWEYYLLSDCDEYKDPKFIERLRPQLYHIYNDSKDFPESIVANLDSMAYVHTDLSDATKLRCISCRHLGHFLHIDIHGNIYPCGYFSDDSYYDDQTLSIGDIYSGLDKYKLEKFCSEYNNLPMCSIQDGCECLHCFECPAISHLYYNNMQHKLGQQCKIRHLELDLYRELFSDYTFDVSRIQRNFNVYNELEYHKCGLCESLPFKE